MFIENYGKHIETNESGTTYYYKHDLFHREGSPAIEFINGDKFSYIN